MMMVYSGGRFIIKVHVIHLVGPWLLDSNNVRIGIISAELTDLAGPVVLNGGDDGSVVVVSPIDMIPSGLGLDARSPDGGVDLVVHITQSEVGRLVKGQDVQSVLIKVLFLKDLTPSPLDIMRTICGVAVVHIVLQSRNIVDILRKFAVLVILKELIGVEDVFATLFLTGDGRERDEGEMSASIGYRWTKISEMVIKWPVFKACLLCGRCHNGKRDSLWLPSVQTNSGSPGK
jgi:hypothetical protein